MSDNATGPASGHCLCGGVRYRAKALRRKVVACHCEMCRRWTGGLWRATAALRDEIEIEDDGCLAWYGSSGEARRGFCRTCGSSLFFDHVERTTLAIMAGTLDQPTGLELAFHIFVDDKADYEAITDDLPRLPAGGHGLKYP